MFLRRCQAVSLLSFLCVMVKSSDLTDKERNTVVLLFQDVPLSNWNTENKTALLQRITSDVINVVCANNPNRCALNFWNDSRKFHNKHVVVVEAPTQEEKDIQVKLYVSLPDGSDIRKNIKRVIPGTTLQEILDAYKDNITAIVGAEIKSINVDSDESKESDTDNKMNYIMIPISFAVLIVLCFVACCLHFASKRRQKAIDIERRKQIKMELRENSAKPSTAKDTEGHVPTQNTTDNNVSITVTHEETKKKRRKKHKTTEESYINNEQQVQLENDEGRDFAPKRKKKTKHSKHQRLEEHSTLAPAVQAGQWEEGERERVPTPMPIHRGLSISTDPEKSLGEPRERRHKRRKKHKKTHSEPREHDEGFDEGSETRQTGNSEDSLLKSLPRPRQLAPLRERSPPTVQL